MSIKYNFTDHRTIRIECADEWIEVGLPDAGTAKRSEPEPSSDPSPPTSPTSPAQPQTEQPLTSPPSSKPIRLTKPTYPRTSLVVTSGKTGTEGDVFGDEAVPYPLVNLSRIKPNEPWTIKQVIDDYATSIGGSRVLDMRVDAEPEDHSATLEALRDMMHDPSVNLDAFRLWTT